MRYNFLILVFIILACGARGQDVIITNLGDTIKCQITKVDERFIYFRFLRQGTVENTLLPIVDVVKYQHNLPGEKVVNNQFILRKEYPRFMLSAGGGYSYRMAKIPQDPIPSKEYLQNLKTGYNIDAQGHYFFNKKYGLGIRYNFFNAKNYIDSVMIIRNDGHTIDTLIGDLGDDVRITNIGPVFNFRFFNKNETMIWLLGLSLGYTGYLDKARLIGQDFTISGSTLGIVISLGADIMVWKNMALGINVSLDSGTLSSITTNFGGTTTRITLDDQQRESMAKVNVNACLRFWK